MGMLITKLLSLRIHGSADRVGREASYSLGQPSTANKLEQQSVVRETRSVEYRDLLKRGIDIAGAGIGLLLLLPVFLVVGIAIRCTSPGPILFRQLRHGRGGQVFYIYKFRTMTGAPKCDADIGNPDDHRSRLTPVGDILRRYCIDELPQLINILEGDMSLVGPRAHPVGLHVEGRPIEDIIQRYHSRHAIRPGITGLAQVMGYRGNIDSVGHAIKRINCDLAYISYRSIRLDIAIISYSIWRFLIRAGNGRISFPLHLLVSDLRNIADAEIPVCSSATISADALTSRREQI